MSDNLPRKLPPMTALEFAIENAFRHFFFGLRLAILWAILLMPLTVLAWYVTLKDGIPDPNALKPDAIAASAALSLGSFIAGLSISVNWHRRIVLGETPSRFGWVRLDGVVWRYLGGIIVVILAVGVIAAAAAAAAIFLPGTLATGLSGLAGALPFKLDVQVSGLGYVVAALLGLSAFFTLYRLSSWLPAIAVGDKDYSLRRAWTVTRKNRFAYLFFTFWLIFALAIFGGIGAAAVLGAQASGQGWALPIAIGVSAVIGWLQQFILLSITTSHYCHFAQRDVFPKPEGQTGA